MSKGYLTSARLAQVFIGFFFLFAGLQGLATARSFPANALLSGLAPLAKHHQAVAVVVLLSLVVSGAIMVGTLFLGAKNTMGRVAACFLVLLWLFNGFFIFFIGGVFVPTPLQWLKLFSLHLVVLFVLLLSVGRNRGRDF